MFYASTFEQYLKSVEKYNLHPELNILWDKITDLSKPPPNMIFYGPNGVGKYSQVLHAIRKYNPQNQKKMSVLFNKQTYIYNLSNIHYEIDFALLGCNSKLLWHEIFIQIIDIITIRNKEKIGIIVCKNFHTINNELLEIFYSYMQQYNSNISSIHISYIIITEHVSFLPLNILNTCKMINISRPTKEQYIKLLELECSIQLSTEKININLENIEDLPHLKELFSVINNEETITNISTKKTFYLICDNIIKHIINYDKLSFTNFRDVIYDIFIYNLNVADCIWYIVSYFIKKYNIPTEIITNIILKSYSFLEYFNNNYRPIYHLESFFIYIIIQIFINKNE